MTCYEKKGVTFEFSVKHRLQSLEHIIIISQFPIFSFALRRLTLLDLLVLVNGHVIVLELKGFSSQLEGNYSDRHWTGTSYRRNYQVFNPIIQVKEKTRSLQRGFRERGLKINGFVWDSYIVVPDTCRTLADSSIVKSEEEIALIVGKLAWCCSKPNESLIKTLLTGAV